MKKMMLLAMVLMVFISGAIAQEVNGDLSIINGVKVYRVWGDHYERGYAQGYLMSDEVLAGFDNMMLDFFFTYFSRDYELARQFFIDNFIIEEKYTQEAQGIIDGILASGGSLFSENLERDIDINDILAYAATADLVATPSASGSPAGSSNFCSTLSSWGAATTEDTELNGGMVVLRNLDLPLQNIYSHELYNLTIHYPEEEGELKWVQVSFVPGFISATSAINEKGFAVFSNQGNIFTSSNLNNLYPTQLALRNCVEIEDGNGDDDYNLLDFEWERDQHNYLYASISTCVSPDSAIVLEQNNSGHARRSVSDNTTISGSNLAATNHFRELASPTACARYSNIADSLNANGRMSVERSWNLMRDAAGIATSIQTMQFSPATRTLSYAHIQEDGGPSHLNEPSVFNLDYLLSQTPVATSLSVIVNDTELLAETQISNPLDNQIEVLGLIKDSDEVVVASSLMFDDGQHNDGAADDRVFGTSFELDYPDGEYILEVTTTNLDSNYTHYAQTEFVVEAILVYVPDDYASIQEALNAVNSGDTILVAAGTYVENINFMGKDVVVMSADGPEVTIIDGNQNGSVVSISSGETEAAVLDGFTITNGNGTLYDGSIYGGGVFILDNSSPSLKNLIVSGNSIPDDEMNGGGGIGIIYNSHPKLRNIVITNNQSGFAGGGLSISFNSNPVLESVTIHDNSSAIYGGGVMLFDHCAPLFNQVTVVNNDCDTEAGGVQMVHACTPVIINSVIWGNSNWQVAQGGVVDYLSDTTYVAYSNIQGGPGDAWAGIGRLNWLEGNLDSDPLFSDSDEGDFSLLATSPCIDAGIATFDLDGVTIINMVAERYLNEAPDMGAWEYDGPVSITGKNSRPENFSLNQNFPNPFNPSTTIRYELPQQSDVQIIVYDILGQAVATLVSGNQSPGYHSVQWNSKNDQGQPVSAGLYLYSIRAGEFSKTRKMLLVK